MRPQLGGSAKVGPQVCEPRCIMRQIARGGQSGIGICNPLVGNVRGSEFEPRGHRMSYAKAMVALVLDFEEHQENHVRAYPPVVNSLRITARAIQVLC